MSWTTDFDFHLTLSGITSKKPNAIQIPRVVSSPANAAKPSYLTLPAEIRNTIYELLFKREGPIFPVNPPFHEHLERELQPRDENDYSDSPLPQPHNLCSALTLLSSCRQIYCEAVGILYGQNTFVVCWLRGGDHSVTNLVAWAARWIMDLGTQTDHLQNVSVDIGQWCDEICECEYYNEEWYINLLPLLRVISVYPFLSGKIRFQSSARCSQLVIATLTKVLVTLVESDDLNIARYFRFNRLLRKVEVTSDATRGWVEYGSPNDTTGLDQIFQICDSGDIIVEPKRQPLSPYGLGSGILDAILSHALKPPGGVCFDLDKGITSAVSISLCAVNKYLRDRASTYFWDSNTFICSMDTSESRTSFRNFSSFSQWPQGCLPGIRRSSSSAGCIGLLRDRMRVPPIFALNFKLRCRVELHRLRIDIIEFLVHTSWVEGTSTIRIKSSHMAEGAVVSEQQHSMTFRNLRKNILLFLVAMVSLSPEKLNERCPNITINGLGHVVEVHPNKHIITGCVQNYIQDLLQYGGCEGIIRLIDPSLRRVRNVRPIRTISRSDELYRVCFHLAFLCWEEEYWALHQGR
ncbi:hypothetical protein EJ04DRAFT_521355 [Polyplosphaeria fusca]|uniref:DUF7730 domain-containing protein n=1 Tax=Polyplosphaeria fusca TaxID=682080 RepID=A0A9P4V569_9PLEO|nr:hypothetical protein EJ04DRAFT_521355 [Polyplosphaeria fusca]